VGWHKADVLTPHSKALLEEGVQLDRHYTYVCARAPTPRDALLRARAAAAGRLAG
jgi:hypothetical protein